MKKETSHTQKLEQRNLADYPEEWLINEDKLKAAKEAHFKEVKEFTDC